MANVLSLRVAFAAGVVCFALFAAGLITYPVPTTEVALSPSTAAVSVNRTLKGDRLPILRRAVSSDQPGSQVHNRSRAQIPLGCDRAFSPVAAPRLADVYRRCMV